MTAARFEHHLISSDEIGGTPVFDPLRDEIGVIDHLMIDKETGEVRWAIVRFGGFMGLGPKRCPLPWNSLAYDEERNGYVSKMTRRRLEDASAFDSASWSEPDQQPRAQP